MSNQIPMTSGEAMRSSGYSTAWLRKLADAGKIKALRTSSGRYLFDADEIATLAARRRVKP